MKIFASKVATNWGQRSTYYTAMGRHQEALEVNIKSSKIIKSHFENLDVY
jgi:hypothetical protein